MLSILFPTFEVVGSNYRGGDPAGLYVTKDGLKGYEDMPSGRRDAVARPSAHGEFDLPVLRGPRVISVTGVAVASSAFELAGLRSLVTGCGADGGVVPVVFNHQEESLSVSARIVQVTFTDRGYRGDGVVADFSIHMVCPDPRKYGERRLFSGSSVQVHHYGNFPASPVVEVVGPRAAPYTVSGPSGRSVVVSQALTSGQTHRIDFASGGLFRNGVRQIGGLTHYRPWTIDPGKQTTMSISSGSMTVQVADTYM